jgi:hypothetical protein
LAITTDLEARARMAIGKDTKSLGMSWKKEAPYSQAVKVNIITTVSAVGGTYGQGEV